MNNINNMEKNIVKNGTKVILFALGTEDTSVTGVITGHRSTVSGYKCHYKELDGTEGDLDNLQRRNFEIIPNKFINLTPHTITLNNGTEYHPSGKVARVENQFSNFCCGISTVFYGEIENLPEPEEGTIYIVSAMVLAAAKEKGRTDVVAPATGHPDCIRKDGFIVSVPGFVR